MAFKSYRDQAIVLRKTKLGEADVILTLLTARHGQIRAVAKGMRRTGSKFGSRLSPFNQVDIQLYEGSNLQTVVQAESISLAAEKITSEYGRFIAGQVMLETTEKITEDFADYEYYDLLRGAIGALAKAVIPVSVVLSSFLLQILAMAGWAPSWESCVGCEKTENLRGLTISGGGALCGDCLAGQGRRIPPQILPLMRALQFHQWQQVAKYTTVDLGQAEEIAVSYTQWFLERKLKSIEVMNRPI